MKNQKLPTGSKFTILRQLCHYIPPHRVPKWARETNVEDQGRTFSPRSHVVRLAYGQLAHRLGLNDVCDALQLNSGPLSAIRGATPPTRNNLSHSNTVRAAALGEQWFWETFQYLGDLSPEFVPGQAGKQFARRFKRTIQVVDSTTIQWIASCLDWAKHGRRTAAAQCHWRLNRQSFLPRCAIIDTARQSDAQRAREVCAEIQEGEIVLFDKADVDFAHRYDGESRGVVWVPRAKENRQATVVEG